MLGLSAYVDSESSDEDKDISLNKEEGTPKLLRTGTENQKANRLSQNLIFQDDPRIPKEPEHECRKESLERIKNMFEKYEDYFGEVICSDRDLSDPRLIDDAVQKYGIDLDETNLPSRIIDPKDLKQRLPEILSEVKAFELQTANTDRSKLDESLEMRSAELAGSSTSISQRKRRKRFRESKWDK